ncbi:MAG: glycoside hydrolase family 127 protein [Promethearchaeota archaeon]
MQSVFRPAPLSGVQFTRGFWRDVQELVVREALPHTLAKLEETGRVDAFRLRWKPGAPNKPHVFWDSDVAKWVESASYARLLKMNGRMSEQLDELVDLIVGAQQADGYLNTHFTVVEPEKRWMNLRDNHELYCAGHLIEAAVAHHAATGDRKMLDALERYADYIDSRFGSGEGKVPGYPGHEELELALVRLYRATGKERYLALAKYFVDQRGQLPDYFEVEARARGETPRPVTDWYDLFGGGPVVPPVGTPPHYQNHLPVREQEEAVGHAVRALYLYSGMVDVARETGDGELLDACKRLWEDVTLRKTYVTGGVGSSAVNEGFTRAYDLPNETAYAETCAAIASVFFNHRLLQVELDGRYGDAMERALYNGIPSGLSLDGRHFFYQNPLAVTREGGYKQRQEWYACACCPNNLTRLILSLGRYAYSVGDSLVAVHLYGSGTAAFAGFPGATGGGSGSEVVVAQDTDYPWEGRVRLEVNPIRQGGTQFCLALRVPGWCPSWELSVNGAPASPKSIKLERGYIHIQRTWEVADAVELSLDMPVTRVHAHPRVEADQGRVALQRGPVVYCLEEADNGPGLDRTCLPRDAQVGYQFEPDLLGGVVTLRGEATKLTPSGGGDLYFFGEASSESIQFKAVPYFAWGNRGPGEMRVWMREA